MAYAFDVDGVILDISYRLKLACSLSKGDRRRFWKLFFGEELMKLDRPREIGIKLVKDRARKGRIIVITGRPARLKEVTLESFTELTGVKPAALFMRSNNDLRPSSIVKAELVGKAIRSGFNIIEYHDDSEEVLRVIKSKYPWIKLYLHIGNEVLSY